MNTKGEYHFPAVRGIQARREYYVAMLTLRLIPRLLQFDSEDLLPELRAQRHMNRNRLPEITRYILNNREDYTFSALTVSVDGEVTFNPLEKGGDLGTLQISMDSQFIINDGQHRKAAIERAIKEKPELKDETIAVVFFIDRGLERCQQMFADLNRYALRPGRSLNVLYDYRDSLSVAVKEFILKSPLFKELVELEKGTLARRSRKLFTLSSFYTATKALLKDIKIDTEKKKILTIRFWNDISEQFTDWKAVQEKIQTSSAIREIYIHSSGIVLHALGIIGNYLILNNKYDRDYWKGLQKIDWSRENKNWMGRAIVNDRLSKNDKQVRLTANYIKKKLQIPFKVEEEYLESQFKMSLTGNDT